MNTVLIFTVLLILYASYCAGQDGRNQEGNRFCPGVHPSRIKNPRHFYNRQIEYANDEDTEALDLNSSVSVRQGVKKKCRAGSLLYFRSFDGECTNPVRPYVGRAGTPFFSYWKNHDSSRMGGAGLKSAREISNIVLHQYDDSLVDRDYKLRESAVFMGQFLDHSIVLSSADVNNSDSDVDILVPFNDESCFVNAIQFTRNVRANKRGKSSGPGWARAINVLSSAVDLFGVYGDEALARKLRSGVSGQMRYSPDGKRLLPRNDRNIPMKAYEMNAPKVSSENERKQFFIAGDSRSNENPQLTALHTLWLRNHNRIAIQLASDFPDKRNDDNWLFLRARRLNQAEFQAVIYDEFLPAMIGEKLKPCATVSGGYECFKQSEDAGVSDIFANAAFRVGHTMIGNKVHRVSVGLGYMSPIRLEDSFFSKASLLEADGIEPYLLGAIWNQAQKVDNQIVRALRIKLFENTDGEDGIDLASLNIQRGRDTNLPSFAAVKKRFVGTNVRSFWDITKNRNIVRLLQEAYDNAQDVELYVGLLCEDHAPGKPMGPTLIALWKREFERLRDGDYYFYQNIFKYSDELRNYGPLKKLVNGGGPKMRDIILYNTNIKDSDLPNDIWKM